MPSVSTSAPIPVLLDCDPGIDDAVALADLFARRAAGEVHLESIVVTAGNMDRASELRNAAAWRDLAAQIDPSAARVPIRAGAATQLVCPHPVTPETHGPGGAGWASFAAAPAGAAGPVTTVPSGTAGPGTPHADATASCNGAGGYDAADGIAAWREATAAHDGTLHAIVVGPLTTLALALAEDPGLLTHLASLTIMGGSFFGRPGNTTAVAEWNLHTDPEAARAVLASCGEHSIIPLICGQNLTDHAQITPAQITRLRRNPRALSQDLARALDFYVDFHERMGEGSHAKVHDLAAVALALAPHRVRTERAQIGVACEDPLTRGMSVAELRPGRWERGEGGIVAGLADIASRLHGTEPTALIDEWLARHLAWADAR